MLPDSYNVPAYKFALVKFDSDVLSYYCDEWQFLESYMTRNSSSCHFVPFENVDGLTVE